MKLFLLLFLFIPSLSFAGEYCSDFGGACKEACAPNEVAEQGGFIDCTDKQECCVIKESPQSAAPASDAFPAKDRVKDEFLPRAAPLCR